MSKKKGKCVVRGCKNKVFRQRLCFKHYHLKKGGKCIIEGCDGEYGVRGMCSKHYARWRKHGDPHVVEKEWRPVVSLKERLYSNLKPNEACLDWTGSVTSRGYGQMTISGVRMAAHRVAWEIENGPIPEGMHVCHKCDRPCCCASWHLFLSDAHGNQQDCMQKGRSKCLGLKGEEHLLAKLNEPKVMAIRLSSELGAVLAKKYDVTQTTISEIQKGKSWSHLPSDPDRKLINKTYKLTKSDVLEIRASNEDSRILAEQYGVTMKALADARYGRSWKDLPGAQVAKNRSPLAKKFTREDILAIRASNEPSKVLAAQFGVDRSSINNIRSRRTWNHTD